jgi:hypothetical protein
MGEIDKWIEERRPYGYDLSAFNALHCDIHALVAKALNNTSGGREEQEEAVTLLERLDGLPDIRASLSISSYYQWRIQKERLETGSGDSGERPPPEEMIRGFIELYRAAMNVRSTAWPSVATGDATPSSIYSGISMGLEDLKRALDSGGQAFTIVGKSLATLHEQLTLLQVSQDSQHTPTDAWPFRQVKRIALDSPEPSITLSDVLANRQVADNTVQL